MPHGLSLQASPDINVPIIASSSVSCQIVHLTNKAVQRQVQILLTEGAPIQVQAEAFLLGQAIYNVLENALDFSPDNATISIRISQLENNAVIQIQDQGAGIPDYAIDKIFDKFYSLPRPATGQKSTGLGLNFVQEVLKLHSGSITLGNHPEGGVIATITLPIS